MASQQQFEFPSIHNFPPFYTKQPNDTTYKKQSQQWAELILAYYKHHRKFVLDLNEELNGKLFCNQSLNRRLNYDTLFSILTDLVSTGSAEWMQDKFSNSSPNKKHVGKVCLIKWRKGEEWARLILEWVFKSGSTNSVLTGYELLHGESTESEEFHNLHPILFQEAIQILTKQGKCQVFSTSSSSVSTNITNVEEMGIKFF